MAADPIAAAIDRAVHAGVFPGAVLAVSLRRRVIALRAFGMAASRPAPEPLNVDTVYDLASLTKPFATATAVALLLQDGRLSLEDRLERHFPELDGRPLGAATLFHLLNHSSGLPGWRPLYKSLGDRHRPEPGSLGRHAPCAAAIDLIAQEPLLHNPGEQSIYSDLGFILLGIVIERVSGFGLADFCKSRIFDPLDAHPLCFLRVGAEPAAIEQDGLRLPVAPTEYVAWRGGLLRGEVHDDNAYALGGVAGHAGLFGTAAALLKVSGAWLRSYHGVDDFLDPAVARRFTARQSTPGSSWGLGWDTPSAPSSSGRYFSARSFGHLGFTGTSVWVDPTIELEIVLLSNRVHVDPDNAKIQQFRPLIHDAVYEEVIERRDAH
jgi:CubicO group peptidase (beta-lactamase class C family)